MKKYYRLIAIVTAMSLAFSTAACSKATVSNAPSTEAAEPESPANESAVAETEPQAGPVGSAGLSFPAATTAAETEEETTEEETTEEETTEEETEPETTAASYSSSRMDVTNVDFDELSDYDNTAIEYGFNNSNRDSLNRPEDLEWYDSKYAGASALTHIDTDEKIIYLTMDEGYENGYTPKILDVLKKKNVKVVFFITKQFYDENPDLIQRMIDEGHTIGNHTCSHPSGGMPQLGAKAEYEDIKKLNDLVYDKYGYQMKLFRFPEGVASKQAVKLVDQMGYTSVFWSFAYRDYDADDQMGYDEALDKCVQYLHPGAIYLLHAISSTNAAILGEFIDEARDRGYEFAKVTPQ